MHFKNSRDGFHQMILWLKGKEAAEPLADGCPIFILPCEHIVNRGDVRSQSGNNKDQNNGKKVGESRVKTHPCMDDFANQQNDEPNDDQKARKGTADNGKGMVHFISNA